MQTEESREDPDLTVPPQDADAPLDAPASLAARSKSQSTPPLLIKIRSMAPATRASTRQRTVSNASGSEYHESNASMDVDDEQLPIEEKQEPEEEKIEYVTSRGRRTAKKPTYKESASEDDMLPDDLPSTPAKRDERPLVDEDDDDDIDVAPRYPVRRRHPPSRLNGFIASDDDGPAVASRYETRSRSKNVSSVPELNGSTSGGRITRRLSPRAQAQSQSQSRQSRRIRSARRTRSSTRIQEDDDGYVDEPSPSSQDADGEFDDIPRTSSDVEPNDADAEGEIDAEADLEPEPEQDGRPYSLRQRAKINYAIPPPLEEVPLPPSSKPRSGGRANGRSGGAGGKKVPGWSATGAELSRWMGGGADDSDSDYPTRTPRKPFGAASMGGMFAGSAGGTAGVFPSDLAATAGTPSNLGKVGDATFADADPLGVNQNVTFDEVGGLDEHINSLKEMTLLPLLYPEVFQRFGLTPPRGVLFHGPPGTGKTLLARALAASCRSDGKSISFFMRKGADCLSKWVGEAERQLRLLFEEARNQQPSIIFFDEIDGLAPVRSSKQDQIHASIVSTLLALMDGMDGRGQVIVIGATNRPDAIDPALRRPGRFDREFYFPLPSLEARDKILRIMTQKWAGWDGEKGGENVKGLAKLTKGYGGADLRALCTEAALNAVQRRYPQIYKTSERLLLKAETIDVELRDFMIAIKKIVPSSARSVSSAASPLPAQLVPLLQESLDRAKDLVTRVLPVDKKRSALEEAEWEDESGEGSLERELMLQSMETLRVYRPRIVLHGPAGMGQEYVAAAMLHHLEGHHIQSLDLGSLMSDSTRTTEAAIVQLFVEAKRHQPSVIYIPSLLGWSAALSETARTTVRAMLDTLAPTDPVLLLAVVDGAFTALPRDIRAWFGPTRENRVELTKPNRLQREGFFEGLLRDVRRPPNQFPDGMKRKKRVLEELPVAPPLEPRQPTAEELALQEESDQRVTTLLKYRLGPILQELKRKFKRFTKRAVEEYNYEFNAPKEVRGVEVVSTSVEVRTNADGVVQITEQHAEQVVAHSHPNGVNGTHQPVLEQPPEPHLFDMDLERMHVELYRNRYLTPDDFLDDIRKIVHNADVRMHEDPDRLFRAQAMLTAAEVSINDFDTQFRLECQRTAVRERRRREEYRKQREQEKAKEREKANEENGNGQNVYAPGTRRSARHNGQQPEISITDPLKLERKLKRQRSTSAAATPSEDEGGDRQKRSRLASEEHDPIDMLTGPPSSPERLGAVRFADPVERMPTPTTSGPSAHLPSPYELDNAEQTHEFPGNEPSRRVGFDPSLLNPLPSPEDVLMAGPSSSRPDSSYSAHPHVPLHPTQFTLLSNHQPQPQPNHHQSPHVQSYPYSIPPPNPSSYNLPPPLPAPDFYGGYSQPEPQSHLQPQSQPQPQSLSHPQPQTYAQPSSQLQSPPPEQPPEQPAPARTPTPMEVQRAPTPLPDFILDEGLLSILQQTLMDSTDALSVEELEQLRALCLSRVWLHRQEWDRTKLMEELRVAVKDFVREVALSDEDMQSP